MSCVPDASRGFLARTGTGGNLLPFFDFDAGPFGQVVEVENLARAVFENDLRMQVALVLDDGAADVAAGFAFAADRPAFDAVFEADLAADFGQNGHRVRVPLAEHLAGLDFFVFVRPAARHRWEWCTFRARAPSGR